MFSFDGRPEQHSGNCPECDQLWEKSIGFVLFDEAATAVYTAESHHSTEHSYVICEVILDDWTEGSRDRVVFAAQFVAPDNDQPWGWGLISPVVYAGLDLGRTLGRDLALQHPLVPAFWQVIDWLTENDPLLHRVVFHELPEN
jgi:hypothetical protein